jgi:TPR repeat protein
LGVGCVGVAAALATGKGRKQDSNSAFKYLQRGCKADKEEGCYALGLAHLYGEITPKNEAAARHELGVACEAGHADACRVLAELAGEP